MAKVNVKANFVDKYFPVIEKVSRDEMAKTAQELGKKLITGKTRSGNQLVDNAEARKQPPLSPAWKARRGRLSSVNETHALYSQNRSNLTFTGQLINALTSTSNNEGNGVRIKFFVSSTARQPYKNLDGSNVSETPNNSELAGYLADKGRFFVGLDTKSRTQINNELTRILRRRLKVLIR